MMVEYAAERKRYKMWYSNMVKFIISRDVTFEETSNSSQPEIHEVLSNSSSEIDSLYSYTEDEASEIEGSEKKKDIKTTAHNFYLNY